jgi:hypothetical protein
MSHKNHRRKTVRSKLVVGRAAGGQSKDNIQKSRAHAQSRAKWKKTGKLPPWKKPQKEDDAG